MTDGNVPDRPGGLSPDQTRALERGRRLAGPVLKAARYSTFTVWTVGVFGGLTVLWGLVSGGGGLIAGAALLALAWNERRGRDLLRGFDASGPRVLGWNQIALGAVVTLYALDAVRRAWLSPDPALQELEAVVGYPTELVAQLTTVVYGVVIVVVDLAQLLTARFHFRREAMIRALRRDVPPWVLELVT